MSDIPDKDKNVVKKGGKYVNVRPPAPEPVKVPPSPPPLNVIRGPVAMNGWDPNDVPSSAMLSYAEYDALLSDNKQLYKALEDLLEWEYGGVNSRYVARHRKVADDEAICVECNEMWPCPIEQACIAIRTTGPKYHQ